MIIIIIIKTGHSINEMLIERLRQTAVEWYLIGLRNADVKHAIRDERQIEDATGRTDHFDGIQISFIGTVGHDPDVAAEWSIQRERSTHRRQSIAGCHRFFVNLLPCNSCNRELMYANMQICKYANHSLHLMNQFIVLLIFRRATISEPESNSGRLFV